MENLTVGIDSNLQGIRLKTLKNNLFPFEKYGKFRLVTLTKTKTIAFISETLKIRLIFKKIHWIGSSPSSFDYEMFAHRIKYPQIIKENLLSNFKTTPPESAYTRQIASGYKRIDHFITGDAVNNILSVLFDPYSKALIMLAILIYLAIFKFQSKKAFSESIWEISRNLIQRTELIQDQDFYKFYSIYFSYLCIHFSITV